MQIQLNIIIIGKMKFYFIVTSYYLRSLIVFAKTITAYCQIDFFNIQSKPLKSIYSLKQGKKKSRHLATLPHS